MSTIRLGTYGGRRRFAPGDPVEGKVLWILEQPATAIEVQLVWYAEGKSRDRQVVDAARFDAPAARGEAEFRFVAPGAPYSFRGHLVALRWALEAAVDRASAAGPPLREAVPIILSPHGRALRPQEGDASEMAGADNT